MNRNLLNDNRNRRDGTGRRVRQPCSGNYFVENCSSRKLFGGLRYVEMVANPIGRVKYEMDGECNVRSVGRRDGTTLVMMR